MQGIQQRIRFLAFGHSWCFPFRCGGLPALKFSRTHVTEKLPNGVYWPKTLVKPDTFC